MPLFRLADGRLLRRGDTQDLLCMAALAEGLDPRTMGTHSLRIGGASALYHQVRDLAIVKRFGRWASDAFHSYLWEAHEPQAGLAAAMARDATTATKAPLGPGVLRPPGDGPPDVKPLRRGRAGAVCDEQAWTRALDAAGCLRPAGACSSGHGKRWRIIETTLGWGQKLAEGDVIEPEPVDVDFFELGQRETKRGGKAA